MVAHMNNLELARILLTAKSLHYVQIISTKTINKQGILINWYTYSNPVLFKIEYSKDAINWVSQTVSGTSRSFYLHNAQFKNKWDMYRFRIKAKTKHGWSDYTSYGYARRSR